MRGIKKRAVAISLSLLMAGVSVGPANTYWVMTAEAHSGRTDSNGGHKDNKNKSGLGSYHYHCGGYPAHLHTDGVCPYAANPTGASGVKSDSSSDKELIKKVQQALNDKGYDCGEPDGIAGKKTKDALKKFQKDNNLTVDGAIGEQVKKALEIS